MVKITELPRHRASWNDQNKVSINQIAGVRCTGYIVAARRTPEHLDLSNILNFDVVLCDRPLLSSDGHFVDRQYHQSTGCRPARLHQFHLQTSLTQADQLLDLVGQRIKICGISSIVSCTMLDGTVAALYCRDPEFLGMVGEDGGADWSEYRQSRELEAAGFTHCHMLINPKFEVVKDEFEVALDFCFSILKFPVWFFNKVIFG